MKAVFIVAPSTDNFVVVPNSEALVLENFTLLLKHIPCFHHPIRFKKDQGKVRALIDLGSKVNVMTPAYMAILSLKVRTTDVKAQKINSSSLAIYKMVIAGF